MERQVKEAKSSGRESLAEVQRQISALEESNRVLVQKITMMKNLAETKDPDEEKARIKIIDEHEDEEDLKVEQEWVESENALKTKQDQIKSEFDEVYFTMIKLISRQIENIVRHWRC